MRPPAPRSRPGRSRLPRLNLRLVLFGILAGTLGVAVVFWSSAPRARGFLNKPVFVLPGGVADPMQHQGVQVYGPVFNASLSWSEVDVAPLPSGRLFPPPPGASERDDVAAVVVCLSGDADEAEAAVALWLSWRYVAQGVVPLDLVLLRRRGAALPASLEGACRPFRSVQDSPACVTYACGNGADGDSELACLASDGASAFLLRYERLLRAPLASVVTPEMATWRPGLAFAVVLGGSSGVPDGTQEQLEQRHAVARALGLVHRGWTPVDGRFWYGPSAQVVACAGLAVRVAARLAGWDRFWKYAWNDRAQLWAYAAEIAVNHLVPDVTVANGVLGVDAAVLSHVLPIAGGPRPGPAALLVHNAAHFAKQLAAGHEPLATDKRWGEWYAHEWRRRAIERDPDSAFVFHGSVFHFQAKSPVLVGHVSTGNRLTGLTYLRLMPDGRSAGVSQVPSGRTFALRDGLLRWGQRCVGGKGGHLTVQTCRGGLDVEQIWEYRSSRRLLHLASNLCLSVEAALVECSKAAAWAFV